MLQAVVIVDADPVIDTILTTRGNVGGGGVTYGIKATFPIKLQNQMSVSSGTAQFTGGSKWMPAATIEAIPNAIQNIANRQDLRRTT